MRTSLVGIRVCCVVAAALVTASCNSAEHKATEPTQSVSLQSSEAPRVKTAVAKLEVVTEDLRIPSELTPFREIGVHPKVQGFVQRITVDRGSVVQQGQLLIQIQAPEIDAQCGEAAAKVESAQSAVARGSARIRSSISEAQEAKSKLIGEQTLLNRVLQVSKTPGAIAPFDLEQAEQKVAAAKARLDSASQMVAAAESELASEKSKLKAAAQSLASMQQMKAYLSIRAPFGGVVTDRNVHEGSLVNSAAGVPMLRLAQVSQLRLLIPLPESAASHVKVGKNVLFTVPAHGARKFVGTIERISHHVDSKTRTMIVEADVNNAAGELEPGMYPEVSLQVQKREASIVVPESAVKEIEGKSIVMRIHNGLVEPVEVVCKQSVGDGYVVEGGLNAGDHVAISHLNQLHANEKVLTEQVADAVHRY